MTTNGLPYTSRFPFARLIISSCSNLIEELILTSNILFSFCLVRLLKMGGGNFPLP
jgi:hypothetical protein